MAERRVGAAVAGLLLALTCSLLPLLPHAAAGIAVGLAVPGFALGFAALRGGAGATGAGAKFGVIVLWLLAYATLAGLLAWPLSALLASGSLAAALSLSAVTGLAWWLLWSHWPVLAWAAAVGVGEAHRLARADREAGAGARGLWLALALLTVMAAGVALAWPGLLPATLRLPWVLGLAALSALVVGLLPAPPIAVEVTAQPAADWADLPVVELPSSAPAMAADASEPAPVEALELGPDHVAELYRATRAGQVEAALLALEAGADPAALPASADRDQRTLPMLASLLGDLRLLRALIARGVDLNARHAGLTPLLAATRDSWHGRPEAVMTLLANGADPRSSDADGYTALHHAARSTDPAVAALLLDAAAQVDALGADGVSPLGVACAAGNWRLARYLLEHGAKAEPAGGQPALLSAAGGEDEPIGVQLLLRHKARVDARGHGGRTALLQACQAGNEEIVAALLEAGADRNGIDQAGISPLLEVARSGHLPALRRLALAKPDPSACDELGRNALCLACESGASAEVIKQLLALGVDADQRDSQGRRALDFALAAGRWPLVAVLDPAYPLPASMLESGEALVEKTPRALLREALSQHRLESAQGLLKLGAWPDPQALAGLLLEFADDGERCQWLLRHGASPDVRLDDGDSVLFRLLARGSQSAAAIRCLLAAGVGVGGRGGLARYLDGCARGPNPEAHAEARAEALALDLLARGADGFASDGGTPPLHLALRLRWPKLAAALLAMGVNPDARDPRGQTALHLAATLGDAAAARALIRHGARPELAAPDGQTPLGLALAAGRRDLAEWLDWRPWPLPGRALQPGDLPAAAMAGDANAVRRLLALGLPVDALDHQGCSALLRAAGGGHQAAVMVLLEAGAHTALQARTGATALSAAISMRHASVAERLLAAGAAPNQTLPGAITPLMLAAALGQPDLVDQLLAHGADAGAVDAQGLNALHCACLQAFGSRDRQRSLSLVNALLAARLPIDAPNHAGQTPLLLLLGARAEPGATCDEDVVLAVLERLLAAQASVDVQDQRGLGALHLAATHGLSRVVQRLLREGADRHARDSLGRSPHDLAVQRGYVDVAAEFEPARTSPSLARFLRDPRE